MGANDDLLAARLAKLKILYKEEINAAEYEDERESGRRAEFNEYLKRRQMRKQTQKNEDLMIYKNTEAEIEALELKEQQNERKRLETFKDLRLLDESEEGRRNEELENSLHIMNRQQDRRQHLRLKEIMMEATARRDKSHDRQVEGERNLIRFKNVLAAKAKYAAIESECKQNELAAEGRKIDKQIEYMEERRKNVEEIRNIDKNMLEYLDEWQQKGDNKSYSYEFTPIGSKDDNLYLQ